MAAASISRRRFVLRCLAYQCLRILRWRLLRRVGLTESPEKRDCSRLLWSVIVEDQIGFGLTSMAWGLSRAE